MLAELCKELNNWDFQKGAERHIGDFEIQEGALVGFSNKLADGQYFRIVGSTFNDGIYMYPTTVLRDETFHGGVWAMAIPEEVIALAEEIADWEERYGGTGSPNMSPYTSESFGGYSYTKGGSRTATGNNQDNAGTWQGAFATRLRKWRKI